MRPAARPSGHQLDRRADRPSGQHRPARCRPVEQPCLDGTAVRCPVLPQA